jgi:hypothetical protein
MVELDIKCPYCDKDGIGADRQPCGVCDGYAYQLTKAGETLIGFLKRRGMNFGMSPKAEDELGSGADYD